MTMPVITEGKLQFEFPEGWLTWKYDESHFYRNRFQGIVGGIKAADIIAVNFVAIHRERIAWLIEVKDYRIDSRTNTIDIIDEVAKKFLDTLAAALPAKLHGDGATEQPIAKRLLDAGELVLVLHLELSDAGSRIFPNVSHRANILQKLKGKFARIDIAVLVTDRNSSGLVPWTVTDI